MDRFISAWPLGGGVVLSDEGIAYTAAGSTAADGTVAAAVDVETGEVRWREAYTLDRTDSNLSFGVQGNLLLKESTLFINGGAPVGIVSLDVQTGRDATIASRMEAGMEVFLDPDGQPIAIGPELFSGMWTRPSLFKQHLGRVYFEAPDRTIALVDGRLFCAHDTGALDGIVEKVYQTTKTARAPSPVLHAQSDDSILWAGETADVCGLALGTDGLVVLHSDSVQGLSLEGESMWTVNLPAPPVRWGLALAGRHCVVTLTNGTVLCLEAR
jgi:outer membrane protein assembly factor BamB